MTHIVKPFSYKKRAENSFKKVSCLKYVVLSKEHRLHSPICNHHCNRVLHYPADIQSNWVPGDFHNLPELNH